MATDPTPSKRDRAAVGRGALLSLIGKIAESLHGVGLVVAAHLYGLTTSGVVLVAYKAIDLVLRFCATGFGDAVVFFGAQVRAPAAERLGRVGRSIAWALGLSAVLAAVLYLASDALYHALWSDQPPQLIDAMHTLVWMLPLSVAVKVPIEAIRAQLDIRWSVAVSGGLVPALTFVCILLLSIVDTSPTTLALAFVIPNAVCLPIAVYGFSRYYSIAATARAALGHVGDRAVFAFALPQSFNMAFSYGLTNVDTLMLAIWVRPELVAIYAIVSEIMRSARGALMAFASVFAPLCSRYLSEGKRAEIAGLLSDTARKAGLLAIPIVSFGIVFALDIAAGFRADTPWPWFVFLLAVAPVVSCLFGLAAHVLLMAGRSRTLLVNSSVALFGNIGLNAAAIPLLGLHGAALATAITGLVVALAQVWELGHYERISLSIRAQLTVVLWSLPSLVIAMAASLVRYYAPGWRIALVVAIKIALFAIAGALMLLVWDRLVRRPERAAPDEGDTAHADASA